MTGVVYGIAAFLVWGVMPAYWRLLKTIPAPELLGHRVVWSVVFVGGMLVYRRRLPELLKTLKTPRLVATLTVTATLIGGNWLLYIWAVNNGHVLESSLGYFINPLMSVLLGSLVLKEQLSKAQKVAFGLATLGVLVLAVRAHGVPWISLGLALSFALYGLMRKMAAVDSLLGLTVETLLLAPFAAAYLIALGVGGTGAFGEMSYGTDLLLVNAGVLTSLPLLWFAHAAKRLKLATVGLLQYIAPTCQFLLAVFAYDEPFTATHLVSFGLIWLALGIYTVEATLGLRALARRSYDPEVATK